MAEGDSVSWIEVLIRMVDGPTPPHRGRIRSRGEDGKPRKNVGWAIVGGQSPPTISGGVDDAVVTVWRDEKRVRIENSNGDPVLICDGERCWRFRDPELPTVAPAKSLLFRGNGTELLTRRPASSWVGNDFTTPFGEIARTIFLGREAWGFHLEPPPHKPHPYGMVVDKETGLVLAQGIDQIGLLDEWIDLEVVDGFADELFTWTGPAESAEAAHRRTLAGHEDTSNERREWFRRNITGSTVRAVFSAPFDVQYVHELDESTGEFFASLGNGLVSGSLARRLHSQ
ncbi:MAG: hypothetical protein WA931_05810, partial [Rhodococcus sp. (in: high G+C Gram-positive bacteria)]